MFSEFFRFELLYRKVRPATYIYFLLIFLFCFLSITSPTLKLPGSAIETAANAPFVISQFTLIISFFLTLVTSAIISVSIVRDFDHGTDAILFTTPISKGDYLMGRFTGALLVAALVQSAAWLGFMAGYTLGEYMPWETNWHNREVLPFNAWHYWQPFLLFGLTNIFITGSWFFLGGALGKKPLFLYMQGILLVIVYQVVLGLVGDLTSRYWAALFDPFGVVSFVQMTRYWTPAEQNVRLVPFEGVLLYNRVLWISIAFLSLAFTYFRFSFHTSARHLQRRQQAQLVTSTKNVSPVVSGADVVPPVVLPRINAAMRFYQFVRLSVEHFRLIWKEVPFIVIAGSGILALIVNAVKLKSAYGTSVYPTTGTMLTLLESFNLFILIIIIFYSGELIWKERDSKFNQIVDALPVASTVHLLAKFMAMAMVCLSLMVILHITGMVIQLSRGYHDLKPATYMYTLYVDRFSTFMLLAVVALLIQVLVNNKFLGFTITILVFILRGIMNQLGIENEVWQYASGSPGAFSDMNSFGHFTPHFLWFKGYWLAVALVLTVVGTALYLRGYPVSIGERWKLFKSRFNKARTSLVVMFAVIAGCLGSYTYYNVVVLNRFENSRDTRQWQADYELTLGQYRQVEQPEILSCDLQVELFPYDRKFSVSGHYWLQNNSAHSLRNIHVQLRRDHRITVTELKFDRDAERAEDYDHFYYTVYRLGDVLSPGDSIRMDFSLTYLNIGFESGGRSNTEIVYNGTLISNDYFPSIGYHREHELPFPDDRKEFGLPERHRVPTGYTFGTSKVMLDIVVGTSSDQIALTSGSRMDEWQQDGRRYFRYKTATPVRNRYAVISGRYAVLQDSLGDIDLEIYYHPEHEGNTHRMLTAMKDAIRYCSDNIGPYPYKRLQVVEYPRYNTSTRAFPNTIVFSEANVFTLAAGGQHDLDMTYYLTARETAHQWWSYPLSGGYVSTTLPQSLSQYAALMVMKNNFPPETVERYLRYELDTYLSGRTTERGREPPLLQANERQPYIFNNKASLIMHALQDYIGEQKLNSALKRFYQEQQYGDVHREKADDLLHALADTFPDSLTYVMDDMLKTVTLFENVIERAVYKRTARGSYEVTVDAMCRKIKVDSTGREIDITPNDWIDIGIYTRNSTGVDSLVYFQKHKFTGERQTITLSVNSLPSLVGIDPVHKLIDKHVDDNTVRPTQFVEISNIILDF